MVDDTRQSFPAFPATRWWSLREKFRQSLPNNPITVSYLETTLGISTSSARSTLTALRDLQLVDGNDIPTGLAERWRHDDTYSEACREIRERVYPEELFNIAPNPAEDKDSTRRWFARAARVGQCSDPMKLDTESRFLISLRQRRVA